MVTTPMREMPSDPDPRILQANERTLLAWIRTGLTLMAFGFVIARISVWLHLEHPDQESPLASWLGVVVVALGTACHIVGAIRYASARRAILGGQPISASAIGPIATAVAVAATGIAAIVYLVAAR